MTSFLALFLFPILFILYFFPFFCMGGVPLLVRSSWIEAKNVEAMMGWPIQDRMEDEGGFPGKAPAALQMLGGAPALGPAP